MLWPAPYLLLLVAGLKDEGQCLLQTFLERHALRAPDCTTGRYRSSRQLFVHDCGADILAKGTEFCVSGETFTVGSSWNSVAGTARGATVNLATGSSFAVDLFAEGDPLTIGPCGSSESIDDEPMVGIFGYPTRPSPPPTLPTGEKPPKFDRDCDVRRLKDAGSGYADLADSDTANLCHIDGRLLWWENWDSTGEPVGVECQRSCCTQLVSWAETQCGGKVKGSVECAAAEKQAPSSFRQPPSGIVVGENSVIKSTFSRPPSFDFKGHSLLCKAIEGLATEEEVWNPAKWNVELLKKEMLDTPKFIQFGVGACDSSVGLPTFYWKEGLTQMECEEACSGWCQAYQTGLPKGKVGCSLYPADDATDPGPPRGFQTAEGVGALEITTTDPIQGFTCYKKSPDGTSLNELALTCSVFTLAEEGGECNFDREREDCAVCAPGACPCGEGAENRCVPCGKGDLCEAEAALPLCAADAPCAADCVDDAGLIRQQMCNEEKCMLCGEARRQNCARPYCPSSCLGGAGLVREGSCEDPKCQHCDKALRKFCDCPKDCLGGAGLVSAGRCNNPRCQGCSADLRKFCTCAKDCFGASGNVMRGKCNYQNCLRCPADKRAYNCQGKAMQLVHGRTQVDTSSNEHDGSKTAKTVAKKSGKFAMLGNGWCMAKDGLSKLYSDSVINREFCEAACVSETWCQAYHYGENGNCGLFVSANAWDDAPPPGFTLSDGIGAAQVTTIDSVHTQWTCYKSIDLEN